MTKSQKLILVYSVTAIFIGCCFYQEQHSPNLALLSAGFILGFLANENLSIERKYD
jgi:hypothetical protein